MDLKEIKQIVEMMKRADLTELEIEEEGLKLRICRKNGEQSYISVTPPVVGYPATPAAAPTAGAAAAVAPAAPSGPVIKSPMVGTYYSAPSPDSPVFVKPGDKVTPDTVVCIIEAMKVMNEIKAETSGVIAEVLVENGESVEFGKPLFRLK